eukprot:scaffold37720_cov67-Phaeocystis_antarctica.AAC.24
MDGARWGSLADGSMHVGPCAELHAGAVRGRRSSTEFGGDWLLGSPHHEALRRRCRVESSPQRVRRTAHAPDWPTVARSPAACRRPACNRQHRPLDLQRSVAQCTRCGPVHRRKCPNE